MYCMCTLLCIEYTHNLYKVKSAKCKTYAHSEQVCRIQSEIVQEASAERLAVLSSTLEDKLTAGKRRKRIFPGFLGQDILMPFGVAWCLSQMQSCQSCQEFDIFLKSFYLRQTPQWLWGVHLAPALPCRKFLSLSNEEDGLFVTGRHLKTLRGACNCLCPELGEGLKTLRSPKSLHVCK